MPYTPPEFEDHSLSKEVTAAKLTTMAQAIGNPTAATVASLPAAGAFGTIELGTEGLSRIRNAVLVGALGGNKATWTIPHNMKAPLPGVQVYKELAANEYEQTIVRVKILNENEIEVIFTTAPAAGVVYRVQIDG